MLAEMEGKYEINDRGNVQYDSIFKIPDVDKDELFNRANDFFIYSYKDASEVVQNDDKENGKIIGKGLYSYE